MTLSALTVPMLSDNYAWLLRDDATGALAFVDPADAEAGAAAVEAHGGKLDLILLTHHHDDHIAGADALRSRYGARIVGAAADAHRLPRLDIAVAEGDRVAFSTYEGQVIDTPGHTVGHISYFFPDGPFLFCGDTMFSLGCGRMFEGTAEQFFNSFRKIAALPPQTLICCGHEYTQSNARFALIGRSGQHPLAGEGGRGRSPAGRRPADAAGAACRRVSRQPLSPRAGRPELRSPPLDEGQLQRLTPHHQTSRGRR